MSVNAEAHSAMDKDNFIACSLGRLTTINACCAPPFLRHAQAPGMALPSLPGQEGPGGRQPPRPGGAPRKRGARPTANGAALAGGEAAIEFGCGLGVDSSLQLGGLPCAHPHQGAMAWPRGGCVTPQSCMTSMGEEISGEIEYYREISLNPHDRQGCDLGKTRQKRAEVTKIPGTTGKNP